MPLRLPKPLHTRLIALARASRPLECVGVLAGPAPLVASALYPLQNVASDPAARYLADAHGLARALWSIRGEGLALVAIYHSHPDGPAVPSRLDLDLAAWEVPAVIVDAAAGAARAWLLENPPREVGLEVGP